jgi:peptidoglycan/LPS O-acetylase OafA/YrhL
MPEPVQRSARYMPALDGLRALAVCAVIAYHLGLSWAPGGLLGVGVFFTLSGYLITDLLLARWEDLPRSLGDFWVRRARRLLPALYVMLVVVVVWVAIGHHSMVSDVRGQVLSAVLYVNNWWQITRHISYFARFGPPSPLSHLWSLAVEEQFYLVWPWLLLAGLRFVPERRRSIRIRPRLAALTLALAAVSAIEMAILFHPSFDNTRIYDGSDTRAFGLLIGAALAMVWPSRSLTSKVGRRAPWILDSLGAVGLVAIAVMVWRTNQYSPFLYQGGLVLLSLATALVILAGAHPVGTGARLRAAALAGGALLRDLPVARADHRAHHSRERPHHPAAACARPDHGQHRAGGAVLALHRAADPPRRAQSLVGPRPRGALAPAAAASRRPRGARGHGARGRARRPRPGWRTSAALRRLAHAHGRCPARRADRPVVGGDDHDHDDGLELALAADVVPCGRPPR